MTEVMPTPPAEYHYGEHTWDSLRAILEDPAELLATSSNVSKEPHHTGVMDILSASRYPHGLMHPYESSPEMPATKPSHNSTDSLYGGIVVNNSQTKVSNATSTNKQPSRATKKRSSKQMTASDDNDNDDQPDSKKHRGRPRLDTHDKTAADRRRTQIRLAQRAYRHRKETTISALKQKVLVLQATVHQMNKAFVDLHDNIISSGVFTPHLSLARQLHDAADDFSLLNRITATDSDDEDDKIPGGAGADSGPASNSTPEDESTTVTEPAKKGRRGRSSKKQTQSAQRRPPQEVDSSEPEADLPLVSTVGSHDNILSAISQTSFMDIPGLPVFRDLMQFNVQLPDIDPDASPYPDLTPSIPLPRSLTAPNQGGSYTYSFQETSFARRLHRMALERGFRGLTNPTADPKYLKRAFRFTFCFSNRKRIVARFNEILKRGAGESLENWSVPFFNIGGAGTHFPRQDEKGNNIYPPNMLSAAQAFGPQPWVQPETPRTEASTQEMLDAIGFGGEWFDSHDVEEYLKTKGIYLDGQSSYVEVDPSVLMTLNGGTDTPSFPNSDVSSSTRSPHDTTTIRTPSPFLRNGFSRPNPSASADEEPLFGTDLNIIFDENNHEVTATSTSISTSDPSLLMPYSKPTPHFNKNNLNDFIPYNDAWSNLAGLALGTSHLSAINSPSSQDLMLTRRRGPLTFDVELFLETMVNQSACLGRAPGFRKNDIDDALRLSVQESF
ncbi:hypothetical protein PV10_00855 [Exophiala mesophila]|uniref:BZIP domain-containing protein n=1 Tax=Exophiala mesophila TaxID=212818 RepID=A0A0D1ZT44_EXOME|nr:uncharacterized protein PV10_00855 [Exophiala mesophila]KIV97054.1 hypothetical protein PV10_00855 [Exophiala mesophila]